MKLINIYKFQVNNLSSNNNKTYLINMNIITN